MSSILVFVMLGALSVLLCYHLFIFSRLAFRKQTRQPVRDLPISVVVCARNEARALERLVPILMDQDHKEFEVVVVNDRSEDDTAEILEWMKPQFPRLRVVNPGGREIQLRQEDRARRGRARGEASAPVAHRCGLCACRPRLGGQHGERFQ
ncbi:MAG: glycosyltransferase [Flavobacteriales bacterium]|nr:glycosyltransferase [Flavobacteriales bacterium]